jgi:hypothetical protein
MTDIKFKYIIIGGIAVLIFTLLIVFAFSFFPNLNCASKDWKAVQNQTRKSAIENNIESESSLSSLYALCIRGNTNKSGGQSPHLCSEWRKEILEISKEVRLKKKWEYCKKIQNDKDKKFCYKLFKIKAID